MDRLGSYNLSGAQRDAIDELLSLETAEERLTWLFERTPIVPELDAAARTPDRKVPGCLSGLWIAGRYVGGSCTFASYSDSKMVNGVATFLCDLYSGRTPEEIAQMSHAFVSVLGLEGLLSMTRKRAVASVYGYIQSFARSASERFAETPPLAVAS